jgi:hypothetical protein
MGKHKSFVEKEIEREKDSGLHKTCWCICLVFSCICFLFFCVALPIILLTQIPWCGACPPNSKCEYFKCVCNAGFYGEFCNITDFK